MKNFMQKMTVQMLVLLSLLVSTTGFSGYA